MSTSVPVADWIKRIADEERRRDAVRIKEDEQIARKAELVRRTGARLVDELRSAVTRDADAFRDAGGVPFASAPLCGQLLNRDLGYARLGPRAAPSPRSG